MGLVGQESLNNMGNLNNATITVEGKSIDNPVVTLFGFFDSVGVVLVFMIVLVSIFAVALNYVKSTSDTYNVEKKVNFFEALGTLSVKGVLLIIILAGGVTAILKLVFTAI